MAPTIVLRDGQVELSLGSAGSNRLRSAILQLVRYVVDCGMDVDEAVRTGRIHFEAGTLHAEPGFRPETLDELERRGREHARGVRRARGGVRRGDPAHRAGAASNWASSVEPFSASVELWPPVIASSTASK